MAFNVGDRLGPYEIERFLGAGGFGTVYRARDPRLGRPVAIKVLSEAVSSDPERLAAFRQEARAAASLNHPHICSVYDVEHDRGVDYIVMELVEGRRLAELTPSHGLPFPAVVRYGTQISDALGHAHARGVVHGDVKAVNVMVTTAGDTKLVDFGLARRLRQVDHRGATQTGLAVDQGGTTGTPTYMAPETLRGETPDHRSDIWALGILLHEMVAGTPPFSGRTLPELLSTILRDAPSAPPPEAPPALVAIIRRCLAKEPDDRYQAAGEVRSALETIVSGRDSGNPDMPSGRPRRRARPAAIAIAVAIVAAAGAYVSYNRTATSQPTTLAVLPCRALAERDRVKFLEVGIADAIIIALSNAAQLRVRSTSTILRYEGQDIEPREVGRLLSVEYLLTCTLQPTLEKITATVQLVRASDGSTAWGERYEVPRGDLVGLRDRISERVTAALRIRMTQAERERASRRYSSNAAAYERYLQGRASLPRYTREATLAAIEHFKSALALDPENPLAHAGLASAAVRMRLRFSSGTEGPQWRDLAEREAREALRIDPDLAEAHEARAAVAREGDYDWPLAMEESRRALALNPSLSQPHFFRASVLYHVGLLDLSEREVRLGMANDPLSRVEALRLLGNLAMFAGRYPDAVTQLEEAQRLSESRAVGTILGLSLHYVGRTADAAALLERLGAQPRPQAALASVLAARGQRARALPLVAAVLAAPDIDHHAAYSLGAAFAQLGDAREAVRWLERAVASGLSSPSWLAADPLLAPIRGDAGYQRLLAETERAAARFRERYGSL